MCCGRCHCPGSSHELLSVVAGTVQGHFTFLHEFFFVEYYCVDFMACAQIFERSCCHALNKMIDFGECSGSRGGWLAWSHPVHRLKARPRCCC